MFIRLSRCCQLCFIIDTNNESPVGGAGVTSEGKEVYLCDIWPSREEVQQTEEDTVISSIFKDLKGRIEVRARSFLPSCLSNVCLSELMMI